MAQHLRNGEAEKRRVREALTYSSTPDRCRGSIGWAAPHEGVEVFEEDLLVPVRIDLRIHLADDALRIDEKGRAIPVACPIPLRLADAESAEECRAGVDEQVDGATNAARAARSATSFPAETHDDRVAPIEVTRGYP